MKETFLLSKDLLKLFYGFVVDMKFISLDQRKFMKRLKKHILQLDHELLTMISCQLFMKQMSK